MKKLSTRAWLTWLGVILCFILIPAMVLYPLLWRRSNYYSLRRVIESGNETAAIQELDRIAGNVLFKPDWTPSSAMPDWAWVHDLDFKLFGCPSCRGIGWRLSTLAAHYGQERLVNKLFAIGASIDSYGDRGCGLLKTASFGGNTNIIKLLLARGADVNSSDFSGPVIHIVAGYGTNQKILQFLLELGAKPNVMDERGWTALDWSTALNSNSRTMLLAYGAVASTNRRIPLPQR